MSEKALKKRVIFSLLRNEFALMQHHASLPKNENICPTKIRPLFSNKEKSLINGPSWMESTPSNIGKQLTEKTDLIR